MIRDSQWALPNLEARLGRVEHFKHLPIADIRTIIRAGQVRHLAAGAVIYREGDPCAGMFVLLEGRVHLCKLGPQGRQAILAVIEPIIMFNEATVLDGGPNATTALAVEDCALWQIDYDPFQALMQRYPEVGLALLKVLAKRMRYLISQNEDLAFRSVLSRTAKLLLDLSHGGERPIDRRQYTNAEMAARLSTVPEALSRSLQVLRTSGDIHCTRSAITIRRSQHLADLAQIEFQILKS